MTLTRQDLSADQLEAYDAIASWVGVTGPLVGFDARTHATGTLTMGGYAGCLAGDTIVEYSRGPRTGVRPITLRDMYLKFNGHHGSGRGAAQKWDPETPTSMHALWPDGTVSRNRVVAVFESGVKKCIRLEFDDDSSLTLTPDHPIATPTGEFVEAGSLLIGDNVLARGSMKCAAPGEGRRLDLRPPRIIVNLKYHPFGARKTVVCNGVAYEYTRVNRARLVVEAHLNKMRYDDFVQILKHDEARSKTLEFLPQNVDVHHKDESPLNDALYNLEVLPHDEHARQHGADAEKHLRLEYTREVKVVASYPVGEMITYDVQMANPANNFVANGIFVHNTGKTTLLSVFATEADCLIAFVAFTGKASSVLSRKLQAAGVATTNKILSARDAKNGVDFGDRHYCGTIHSLIYRPCPCTEPRKKGEAPIKRPCDICHEKRFSLRAELDRQYDLIVVDEASMVSNDMLADLRRFNLPILAVGDHGQLPPVSGTGSLMRKPDIRLEKIHRQAEGNPIIALSRAIRETGDYDTRYADGNRVRFGSLRDIPREVESRFKRGMTREALFDSALICYTNKRRVGLNGLARKARGLRGPPCESELVICLRNQKSFGVFNGMRGYLLADSEQVVPTDPNADPTPWLYRASVEFPEEGLQAQELKMCGLQFNRDKTFAAPDDARDESGIEVYSWDMLGSLFDFGYAMTCHKAQGSSFSDVLVVSEVGGWCDVDTRTRWLYTAITRSSERLTVLR